MLLTLAGCETPGEKTAAPAENAKGAVTEPDAEQKETATAEKAAQQARETAPSRPLITGPAAQKEAQRIAIQARQWLNDGEEDKARVELEYAKQIDPENRQVACLLRGINFDMSSARGGDSTPYTVRAGDSLGSIAQRFLGDTCEFYMLARYNDIKVPKLLSSGQTIRLPGRVAVGAPAPQPGPVTQPQPQPVPTPQAKPVVGTPAPKPPEPTPAPQVEAKKPEPSPAARQAEIDRHYRSGQAAYSRQDLPSAIREFDAVLALDPNHSNARVRRQQAVELQGKLEKLKK